MPYHFRDTEAKLIRDVIEVLDRMDEGRATKGELWATIHQPIEAPVNGWVLATLGQLECLYDIDRDEYRRSVDLHPEMTFEEKKAQIKNALSELLKDNVLHLHLFGSRITRIKRHDEKIEVEVVCRTSGDYILFRAVHTGEYFLNVMRNVSAAYWDETKRIDADKAEYLIAHPDFRNAYEIFYNSSSEAF